jgi:hypothetical protein
MIPIVNARWGRYLRKGLAALLDEADAVRVPPRAAPIDKPVPERGLTTLAEEPTPLPRPVPERGLTTLEDELPSERIQEIPKQVSFPDKKTHWWLDELDQKGTVTLYHGTNIKNLDKIRREGLGTDKEGFTYLTPDPDTGVGYGVMARGEKASKGKRGKAYEQAPFEERALLEIEVPKEMLERNINLQRSDTSVKKLLGSDGLEKFEKANRQKVFGQENVPMDAQHNTPYYDLTEIRFKERISPELIKSFAIKKDRRKVEQKISSKGTSIKQIPAVFKKPEIFDIDEGSVNLDIGGGRYDLGTDYLQKERGIENLVLDKFNRSSKHNEEVLSRIQKREGADSATVANVLNVIKEPEIRGEVIQQSYDNTREGGKVFFQIHQGSGKEAGKGVGRETSKGWQNYKKTSEYVPEIEKIFGKGNVQRKGNIIIATKNITRRKQGGSVMERNPYGYSPRAI